MASGMYSAGVDAIYTAAINLTSADIRIVGVDEGTDAPNFVTDEDLADRAGGARVFVTGNLASKTFSARKFDAADPVVSGVSGATVESLDFYLHTGNEATSTLVCNVELSPAFSPNGSDVTIVLDASGGIFTVQGGS